MDSRPAIARNSVDLPHPEGPRTTRNSLAPTSSETLSSTNVPPKRLLMPLSARPITWLFPLIRPRRAELVIVAGNTLGARDALILRGRFENRARVHLTDHAALHFLPRRLAGRIGIAAGRLERLAALLHFRFGQQHIHFALSQDRREPDLRSCRIASPPPMAASGDAFKIEGEPEVPDWRPSPMHGSTVRPVR